MAGGAEPTGSGGRRKAVSAALVVLLLLIGLLAGRNAMALALATRDSKAALRYDPGNGIALAQEALRVIQFDPKASGATQATALARRAIARDPTSATALGAYGLAATDSNKASAAFAASESLSRRTLPTQLWLIEDAVQHGDIDESLRHYDIALRTSNRAPSILFPVLVGAIDDGGLVTPIARLLARRPDWGGLYLQQLAQSGANLDNMSKLYAMLIRARVDPGADGIAALNGRLIAAHRYDLAWQVYAAANPRAVRGGVRNGNFAGMPDPPSPFDWNLSDTDTQGAEGQIEPGRPAGRLTFTASSGNGGLAARQMTMLTPGTHVVRARVFEVTAPADVRPYFRLECAATGAELGRQPLPAGNGGGQPLAWKVVVPAGCAAQWLSVYIEPTDSVPEVTGAVSDVRVD